MKEQASIDGSIPRPRVIADRQWIVTWGVQVLMIASMILSGCALLPDSKRDERTVDRSGDTSASMPTDASTTGDPGRGAKRKGPNYELNIEAPAAIAKEIREKTLVGRWRERDDYDPLQFEGLVARLGDEVRSILRSDGYFKPEIEIDSGSGQVSVGVKPPVAMVAKPATTASSAAIPMAE